MDNDELKKKTKEIARLYFSSVKGQDSPYNLWKSFDKELAKELSLHITGRIYSREKIPHTTRQLVAVASLTSLSKPDELRLHIHAALNVGCTKEEIAEVIFQTSVYAGIPAANTALKILRDVLDEQEETDRFV